MNQYVVVEFRGGPEDGKREVWPYPLGTREICFPARTSFPVATWPNNAPEDFEMPLCHSYAMTDTGYEFDVLTVTPALELQLDRPHIEDLVQCKARRPLVFTYLP